VAGKSVKSRSHKGLSKITLMVILFCVLQPSAGAGALAADIVSRGQ
jgi:hypothetical protein